MAKKKTSRSCPTLLPLVLLLALSSCQTPPDAIPVSSSAITSSGPPLAVPAESWPERILPFKRTNDFVTGAKLTDLGEFGRCQVFRREDKTAAKDEEHLFLACQYPKGQNGDFSYKPFLKMSSLKVRLKDQNLTSAVFLPSTRQGGPAKAKGLIVYLTSLLGRTPLESALVARFRSDGWHVAAIEPHATFRRKKYKFIIWDNSLHQAAPLVADQMAGAMARTMDHHLADAAYFAEGVLLYLESTRPELRTCSRVLVGASAGAIFLPTVAARIGNVDAAVLVGGGANLAAISLQSTVRLANVEKWVKGKSESNSQVTARLSSRHGRSTEYHTSELTRAEKKVFANMVLKQSKLDPFHTSEMLEDTPVLMLQGSFDRVVPAKMGSLSHEALGKPARWTYPFGHYGLFAILPLQADRIVQWVDQRIDNKAQYPLARRPRL